MRLSDLPFLQSVDERDVDFILLEEFHSEPAFVRWFAAHVLGKSDIAVDFVGAWHSVTDPRLGESDIILLVSAGKTRTAFLVENKIDAFAQPNQSARYLARGSSGTLEANWDGFHTVIVAPARYLDNDTEAQTYDARISYELIQDWLRANTSETSRRDFRLRVLSEAISQNRRGRLRHRDERVAAFFRDLWDLATVEFPDLGMRRNREAAANNTWPELCPEHLRDLYPRTRFFLKTDAGVADVEFHGLKAYISEMRTLNESLLTDGVRLIPKGRTTAALSMAVPPLDATKPLADQVASAREALLGARKLSSVLKRLRLPIERDAQGEPGR